MFYCLIKVNKQISTSLGRFSPYADLIKNQYGIVLVEERIKTDEKLQTYFPKLSDKVDRLVYLNSEDFEIISQIDLDSLNKFSFQEYLLFSKAIKYSKEYLSSVVLKNSYKDFYNTSAIRFEKFLYKL